MHTESSQGGGERGKEGEGSQGAVFELGQFHVCQSQNMFDFGQLFLKKIRFKPICISKWANCGPQKSSTKLTPRELGAPHPSRHAPTKTRNKKHGTNNTSQKHIKTHIHTNTRKTHKHDKHTNTKNTHQKTQKRKKKTTKSKITETNPKKKTHP